MHTPLQIKDLRNINQISPVSQLPRSSQQIPAWIPTEEVAVLYFFLPPICFLFIALLPVLDLHISVHFCVKALFLTSIHGVPFYS